MIPNTVTMVLKEDEMCYAESLTQGDYGQKLVFEGVDLPQAYEVHFSNTPNGSSKSFPGDSTGVIIPDEFLLSGDPVYVWVFLHQTENDGRTVYTGYIPVTRKSVISNDPITPAQQDAFTEMMILLESTIEEIPDTIDAALQEAKDSGEFDGDPGFSPIITVTEITGGHRIRIEDAQEVTFVNVMDGETGNGIAGAQLNPDYTLTLIFTDGTSSTTPSIRGEQGEKGNTGPYYTPHINDEGILTWTNNGGLPNPDPFNFGEGRDEVQEYDTRSQFPARGQSGVIYIVSTTNKLYRWTGANYVEVSPFVIGETENTAFRGDHGKIAYDTAQAISVTDEPVIGKVLSPKTIVNGRITEWQFISGGGDISGKADKVSGAVNGNFAGLDSNGNLTDSGSKASDFGTYSKPVGGIPDTDLAEDYIKEPSSDGTSGQVLTTDGQGGRRWTTVQGGGTGAVIDDSAGTGDTDKAWSANKLTQEFSKKYEKPSSGIPASDIASGVIPDVSGKADKVSSATNGNFAGLDSNGNLTDSGHKHRDYLTQHQDISGKADKVSSATNGNFAGLDSNGNLTDSGHKHSDYLTQHQDISGKADKVSGAVNGNFAALDSNGNLVDSGHKHGDYITDVSGKLDAPSTAGTSGQVLTSDGSGGQSWQTPAAGTVTDVQVNGTSVTSGGVANIPVASASTFGIVKVGYGLQKSPTLNTIMTEPAGLDAIKAGADVFRPIAPFREHEATFYGLAKAAGDATQASSSNPVGTFTGGAKQAIQSMIGINLLVTSNIENGTTASKAYTVGDLFCKDGKLYKATASISIGETFEPGDVEPQNCIETDIITELKAILGLPAVTSYDEGKIMRVVSGEWALAALPSASGVNF